jgi:hypothetical protein
VNDEQASRHTRRVRAAAAAIADSIAARQRAFRAGQ